MSDKTLLERYNALRGRSLADIYEDLGHLCPFVARMGDHSDRYGVLVTQCCRGVAYGYPLVDGRRCRNEWYGERATESVAIPDRDLKDWRLVDTPFDSLDDRLFVMDLHGLLGGRRETVVMNEREALEAAAPAGREVNKGAVITFGKYRDKTVGYLLDHDPGYMQWAMDNIPRFEKIVYSAAV